MQHTALKSEVGKCSIIGLSAIRLAV